MPILTAIMSAHDSRASSPSIVYSMDQEAVPDSSSSSSSSSNKVRQRLRPWLEDKINSGRFPGLQWVDKKEGIFRITWKHGGRADWSEQDALIFKEWAIHTGRFREGTDTPDWPSWKTRLRCALNKLPDIQEIKEMSCYDEPNPYRVYRFVDRRATGSASPPHREQTSPTDDGNCHISQSVYQQQHSRPSVIHQANIPNIITEVEQPDSARALKQEYSGQEGSAMSDEAKVCSLGSDLENISIAELVPLDSNTPSLSHISVDSNINSTEPMDTESASLSGKPDQNPPYQQAGTVWQKEVWANPQIKTEPTDSGTQPADYELEVTLRFRQYVVDPDPINIVNQHGCRMYYGTLQPPDIRQTAPQIWGNPLATQIAIPYQQGHFEPRQDALTMKLLRAMDRGLDIYAEGGCIYVLRRCKTMIFVAPPSLDDKRTVKVERTGERVKIFDFYNDFLPALKRYERREGPKPSAQALVALGQNFRADINPYSNLLISATVCHKLAKAYLSQHIPDCTEAEISKSDDYDRLASATANFIPYPVQHGLYMAETTPNEI